MPDAKRIIAIFDFDGTLVKSDSFFPFLGYLSGWHCLIASFLKSLCSFTFLKLSNPQNPAVADHRTFIKASLLKDLVRGHTISELPEVRAKLCAWQVWIEPMKQALLDHHAQGHHIVVASGGLDVYLPTLLRDLPIDALICTKLGVEDDVLTGEMTSGNCVRERKAEMVAAYLAEHGPFDDSWGYGNLPHDLPMLNLLKHSIIV